MPVPGFRLLTILLAAAALVVGGAGTATAAKPKHKPAPKPSPTRGVVLVKTDLALESASAAGTGIVLTKTGEILTNNHVIRGATTITIVVPATSRTYTASVVGYDIDDDIALIKAQGATNLATATRGNSTKLKLGALTTAVGNANGGGKLVITKGRVTALNKTIAVQDDNGDVHQLPGLIETSARLVPGDSGGPLLNANGNVIGIDAAGSPTFAFDTKAPGYAIPINKAWSIVTQIRSGLASSTVHIGETAFIGLFVKAGPDGSLVVQSVVPGAPAEQAGLGEGDTITSIDGAPVATFDNVRDALFAHHPADTIAVGYTDTLGNQTSATIVLASGPPQ
jgi:S1-C subfamily serine protease